ncbi:MAG: GntR family transcriptional regulator [Clostridiales bacterium]|nr:GntR family transcriptional regulator [Clostridiales bacterium]
MINFSLQNHRPLREIVYEELKRQIMVGEIAPGTRMMEVDLADEMGVSRTPVREAIRKLEKEGLVTIEPRRGAYASDISAKDMVDVLEVRQDLEGMAAGLAAQKIAEGDILQLKNMTRRYKEAVEAGDIEEIIKQDEDFHKFIVGLSDNKTLIKMVSQVQELALRFRYIYYDDFSRFKNQPLEHQEIVEAIMSGDANSARRFAEVHISKLKDFVKSEEGKLSKHVRAIK